MFTKGLVLVITGEVLWEDLLGAEAADALTAKLECPDGTRYYFDSNM